MRFFTTLSFLGAAVTAYAAPAVEPDTASLNTCPTSKFDYDYIVVGSGAGGGPVAARLALAGYSVGLIEHGRDVVNLNTTIPLYLGRSNEDDEIELDYDVKLYNSPQYTPQVHNWYPRASALGGSTIHNALVSVYQVEDDLNTLAKTLGDPSWNNTNMRNYFKKLEKNIYLPKEVGEPAGHGYDGWLYTDAGPSNLLTDPQYYDPQLIDIATGLQSMMPTMPLGDFNTLGADGLTGGGGIVLTKNPAHNRSSVRDFLADTHSTHNNLHILYETMATKVLLCNSGGIKAYGVQVATGPNLLPVARLFKGKQKTLTTKTLTAKYEVIVSAGVYQTPQLLKLSGIGPMMELASNGIVPRVNLPGVGENLIDRLEISVVWKLNQPHKLFSGCKFGDDPKTDPCLQAWMDTGHTNLYSSGPGFWATGYKTDPNLGYLDIWQTWAPAIFRGYLRGYPTEIANTPDVITSIILKGHTQSRGFVRLTGNHPQDTLDINKNLFATPAGKKDLTDLVAAVKQTRAMVANQTLITSHVKEEYWPGASVKSDADIAKWIQNSAWGHHACCTAKIGTDKDPMAVLNKDFQVRGVKNLRVVDISAFPEIPGLFVTTPTYMIAEKAADVILQLAAKNGWKPSSK